MAPYNRSKNGTICRRFINGKCKNGSKCRFFHPNKRQINTIPVQKEIKREPGYCYCGSHLRTTLNKRPLDMRSDRSPTFFIVCSKTGKSIRKCQ
jgi:hypothetical protein